MPREEFLQLEVGEDGRGQEIWGQLGQLAAGASEGPAEGAFGEGDEQRVERIVSW